MRQAQAYSGQAFAALYTYDGDDLGVVYQPGETRFRLWSPTAATANVLLYDTGQTLTDETPRSIPMHKDVCGTWIVCVEGDLKGKYYTFQVQLEGRWLEVVDPYARAVGLNGRRGRIIELAATDPPGWASDTRPFNGNPTDAVIYDLNIRDLSSHPQSGIRHKGKFLGLAETGTTTPGGLKTGLDHILELGVTHVELMHCFDFVYDDDNETPYCRGCNPLNYNAPEDTYATNPIDGLSAVREFKRLVQTLHNHGVGVIMDVAYSHMSEECGLYTLAPGYYCRLKSDGSVSNGSGRGNETASERAMVRKFIVDSVVYWAEEYHIDGFRFDLMGLHDVKTMNLIRGRLDQIDPHILMYGDGRTGGQSALSPSERAVKDNARLLDSRVAMLSDDIRDSIRGGVYDARSPGFVNGAAVERSGDIRFGAAAGIRHPQVDQRNLFWAVQPTQTVTYDSCHHNLTLWDKLIKTNPSASTRELTAMNRMAAAIVLTSQGIPMLHAGEEMARTGNGADYRSNASDEVNRIDWTRKQDFMDLFDYYKGLVALRRAHPAFRIADAEKLCERLRFIETGFRDVVAYTLDDDDGLSLLAAFNGGSGSRIVALPDGVWEQLADSERAGLTPIAHLSGELTLPPCGSAILRLEKQPVENVAPPAPEPEPQEEPIPEPVDTGEPETIEQPDNKPEPISEPVLKSEPKHDLRYMERDISPKARRFPYGLAAFAAGAAVIAGILRFLRRHGK